MDKKINYFAYGSNMHFGRMAERIPSAEILEVGHLKGYLLKFNKRSSDQSAKCNIQTSSDPLDQVWGVLYRMSPDEKFQLQSHEEGYREITVRIHGENAVQEAFTYTAQSLWIEEGLLPYEWYLRYVQIAADHFGFPEAYRQNLFQIGSVADPDPDRHQRETSENFKSKKTPQ